jgi:hypothetical protein
VYIDSQQFAGTMVHCDRQRANEKDFEYDKHSPSWRKKGKQILHGGTHAQTLR